MEVTRGYCVRCRTDPGRGRIGNGRSVKTYGMAWLIMLPVILVLCTTSASMAMEVGDTVDLLVPDISYFPDSLQTRQFTCRAVTEHACWLVQDTTFIDLADTSMSCQVIWDGLMTQAQLDSISAQFEGAGVGVYGAVTSVFGEMPVTGNPDDRLWIAFADIPDYYPNPGGPASRLGSWVCTWPEDYDGIDLTGNNHDLFYVNLGVYKNLPGTTWANIRGQVHTWSVATGLGQVLRVANNPAEDPWVTRGLGVYAQFLCYGLTSAFNGMVGIEAWLDDFATAGGIELVSWCSGQRAADFGENLGGELLWFEYLEQRLGSGVITGIAQSGESGMLGIARAIEPSIPDSSAIETVIYPLYEDWLITNLIAHVAGGFSGGIYRYDFLDGSGYTFTIMDSPASFLGEFYSYPFPTWIGPVGYGMSAQVFAAQYASFGGDYQTGGDTTVRFDGMYNQNNGSGPNLDGNWVAWRVVMSDDSTLQSLDSLQFDALFNGTIQLDGYRTFVILTNNNPGGTAQLRYTFSQDTAPKSLILAALQNGMNQQYLQAFTTLFREDLQIPYGFDWVGPHLVVSHLDGAGVADSSAIVEMEPLAETIWTGQVTAWETGSYELVCTGWDSLGISHVDSVEFAVAYGGTQPMILEVGRARLELPAGSVAPGEFVSMAEADQPGLAAGSPTNPGRQTAGLQELLAGPVAIPAVEGLISFESDGPECSIFRLDGDCWVQVESCFQDGRTIAQTGEGGIYLLGSGPGVTSPSVPSELVILGACPNPFTDQASLSFSIPDAGSASLGIYDISGRLVATIQSGELAPGAACLTWDGRGGSGEDVAPGVYFLRLEALGQSAVARLVRIPE